MGQSASCSSALSDEGQLFLTRLLASRGGDFGGVFFGISGIHVPRRGRPSGRERESRGRKQTSRRSPKFRAAVELCASQVEASVGFRGEGRVVFGPGFEGLCGFGWLVHEAQEVVGCSMDQGIIAGLGDRGADIVNGAGGILELNEIDPSEFEMTKGASRPRREGRGESSRERRVTTSHLFACGGEAGHHLAGRVGGWDRLRRRGPGDRSPDRPAPNAARYGSGLRGALRTRYECSARQTRRER